MSDSRKSSAQRSNEQRFRVKQLAAPGRSGAAFFFPIPLVPYLFRPASIAPRAERAS
jgi:hypothetical protein